MSGQTEDQIGTKTSHLGHRVADEVIKVLSAKERATMVAFPIESMASRWNIKACDSSAEASASSNSSWSELGLEGLVRDGRQDDPSAPKLDLGGTFHQYEAEIYCPWAKGRFTFAHELSHVVLKEKFSSEREELTQAQVESVCNRAASRILLPDFLLVQMLGDGSSTRLTIETLETWSRRARVSFSTLVIRIDELLRQSVVRSANAALVISLTRSRRSGTHLAPRIVARCWPSQFFVPSNKRLATLGLTLLAERFCSTPLFVEDEVMETASIWNNLDRQKVNVSLMIKYKIYAWGNRSNATANRTMIAICNFAKY